MDIKRFKIKVLNWIKEFRFMQYIYLIVFTGFVIRYYLISTVLEYTYPNSVYTILRWILITYTIVNTVLIVIKRQYNSILEVVLMILIIVSAAMVTYAVKDNAVLDFALLLVGAKNVSWKKIAYVYLCVAVIIQGIAYYGATSGIIADISVLTDRGMRHSLGINYPTDMAAHVLFIMLVYASLRESRLTFVEITLMGGVSYWVYVNTFARNDFICAMIMCVCLIIVKILHICKIRLPKCKVGGIFMFLITIVCLVGVAFYNADSAVYQKINEVVSSRIAYGYQGLAKYGITAFGSIVEENQATLGYYFFLDNSFVRIAIKYGWVFLSVITYIYYLCFNKAVEYKKDVMIVVLIVMMLFGISEHHLIDIAFCPIWFMLFSSMKPEKSIGRGQN